MTRHRKAPSAESIAHRVSRLPGTGSLRPTATSRTLGVVPLAATTLVLMLTLATPALAAKPVVNALGQNASGAAGGLFNQPRGIAVNRTGAGGVPAGTFYVADTNNRRIQRFAPNGNFVSAWGWDVASGGPTTYEQCTIASECKQGALGNGAGQLNSPQGAAVDQAKGIVYVTDQGSRRVHAFSATGNFQGAFGWGALDGNNAAGNEFEFCTSGTGCAAPNTTAATGGQAGKFGTSLGYLAIDATGKVYVADRTNRRVDVFTPTYTGNAITGVSFTLGFGWDVATAGVTTFETCTSATCKAPGGVGTEPGQFGNNSPSDIAVDSSGNVYTLDIGNNRVQRFDATPAPTDADFGDTDLTTAFGTGALQNIALDAAGNLLVSGQRQGSSSRVAVAELGSTGLLVDSHGHDLTVTAANGLAAAPAAAGASIFVSSSQATHKVFVLSEAPTVDPVTTHGGTTATFTGSVFSGGVATNYHFEYSTDGTQWTSAPAIEASAGTAPGTIAVEEDVTGLTGETAYRVRLVQNRPSGNGAVTSLEEQTFTTDPAAPAISETDIAGIGRTSATLKATVNPQMRATSYHFEYGTTGPCSSNPCASTTDAELAAGGEPAPVTTQITGLQPGTTYHFRLIADNGVDVTPGETMVVGPDASFTTRTEGAPCPNEAVRAAQGATYLPDCRAYELITPRGLGFRFLGYQTNAKFDLNPVASPNQFFFQSADGLPGKEGGNGYGEAFTAKRTATGWSLAAAGTTGAQAFQNIWRGLDPKHSYGFIETPNAPGGQIYDLPKGSYLTDLSGSYDLLGRGSLGSDNEAAGLYIAPGGAHILFSSKGVLEPNAPVATPGDPSPSSIYDRTPEGDTKVVSLLPGNATPAAGTAAAPSGVSKDGTVVVFQLGPENQLPGTSFPLYARIDNERTIPVAPAGAQTAGVTTDGSEIFYLLAGDLHVIDTATEQASQLTFAGDVQPVAISSDGSHLYFRSDTAIDGMGQPGAPNLFSWTRSSGDIELVATLEAADFQGSPSLGNWLTNGVLVAGPDGRFPNQGAQNVAARLTPRGDVIAFQSAAQLTSHPTNGYTQIYRYDATSNRLDCASCAPGTHGNTADARFGSSSHDDGGSSVAPLAAHHEIANLSRDGLHIFFETRDRLISRDIDDGTDVYEWHLDTQGTGEASILTSGQNSPDHPTGASAVNILGVSADGETVFVSSQTTLLSEVENDEGRHIYAIRVRGGFPAREAGNACEGAACRSATLAQPSIETPGTQRYLGAGNVKPAPDCSRHRRRLKKANRDLARARKAKKAKRQLRTERAKKRRSERGVRACRRGGRS